ncbi:MAG: hypothetical protein AB7L90_09195 [Hyphomicrobiaceae bacterium]
MLRSLEEFGLEACDIGIDLAALDADCFKSSVVETLQNDPGRMA